MHFSKEEFHQNGKGPQKSIVDVFVHDSELGALRALPVRHVGELTRNGVKSGLTEP